MDEAMRKLARILLWTLSSVLLSLNVLAMTKILFGLDAVKIIVAVLLAQLFIGLLHGRFERTQRERRQGFPEAHRSL
ncbi:hypothetical protein [Pseudonocardia sp. H11422]|uniref:hypothetical protein n=1 Tax=Pseudonocardia sp. H11422 TaxID=2835866 RepID=UPI001BDD6AAA|nr:hypothetical protein [Pseudonocardia sp. H11422]